MNVRAIEKPPTDNDVQPMLLRDNADTMGVDVVRASFERDEKFFRRRFHPSQMGSSTDEAITLGVRNPRGRRHPLVSR